MNESPAPRETVDKRLDAALSDIEYGGLDLARETVMDVDDRWFGQFAIAAYQSTAGTEEYESVLPAAVCVELLRGYSRVRAEVLVQLTNGRAHAFTRDPSAAILAGDYLYSAAYRALASLDHPALDHCFDVLTDAMTQMIEGFSTTTELNQSVAEPDAFFEQTAGVLGAGAGAIGATLGGAEAGQRDAISMLGREFSTVRWIQRVLDGSVVTTAGVPVELTESDLRTRIAERQGNARDALRSLSVPDSGALRLAIEPLLSDAE